MKKAFTLLEILLVIAAIGILAAIVIVAINPQQQLAQVRNAGRQNDSSTIQKAINQYLIDEGRFPSSINTLDDFEIVEICHPDVDSVTCDAESLAQLTDLTPKYIARIPIDPNASANRSGYALQKISGNITVFNTQTELNQLSSSIPQPTISREGLVGHWSFQDGEGMSVLDNSDFESQGSLVDSVSWSSDVPGRISSWASSSLAFDGGYVDIPYNSEFDITGDITLSTWVKAEDISAYAPLVGRLSYAESFLYQMYLENEELGLYFENPGTTNVFWQGRSISESMQYNQWHHVAITREGNLVTYYVDGQSIGTRTTSLEIRTDTESGIIIGADGWGPDFVGNMVDVRIYERPLSTTEIMTLSLGFP